MADEGNKSNILRELFIKIGLIGDQESQKKVGLFRRMFRALVGDIKVFQANLAAIAVSRVFSSLNNVMFSILQKSKQLITDSSKLSAVQEDAVQGLITALRISGEYSESNLATMLKFASALQDSSRFGDELIISQLTVAKAFGATNEQAQKVVKAAAEFAAAIPGKTLNETVRQVAKTLGGLAGELGEVNPKIKELTSEELKAGKAAEILLRQFGGSGAKNLNSFNGALSQLLNTFGDALEIVGKPLNDFLVPIFKTLKQELQSLSPTFNRLGQSFAIVGSVIRRSFEALGGTNAIGRFVNNFSKGLIAAALLIEDFFAYLRGERSFLGKKLGAGGIGTLLTLVIKELVKKMIDITVSILGPAVDGVFEWFAEKIEQAFIKSLDVLFLKLKNLDSPILNFGLDALRKFGELVPAPPPLLGGWGPTIDRAAAPNFNVNNYIYTSESGETAVMKLDENFKRYQFSLGAL